MVGTNLYVSPKGRRLCRICMRRRGLEHHHKTYVKKSRIPKTHCKYGHEFTSSNTFVTKKEGHRVCRECKRIQAREFARKKRNKCGMSDYMQKKIATWPDELKPLRILQAKISHHGQTMGTEAFGMVNNMKVWANVAGCHVSTLQRRLTVGLSLTQAILFSLRKSLSEDHPVCCRGHLLKGANLWIVITRKKEVARCRKCSVESTKQWVSRNPEKHRIQAKKYRDKARQRKLQLLEQG